MWHQRHAEIGDQLLKILAWFKWELEAGTELDRKENLENYAFC